MPKHQLKTIETLLCLAEVIPHPPAKPITYQELADAVIDRGSSTDYHAVRRILNNERVRNLLGIEQVLLGRTHGIRYRASLLERFSHTELVAYLVENHLNTLLPKEIRQRLSEHLKPHYERFQLFNEYMRDKHWLKKLTIEPERLGTWLVEPVSPDVERILSALYREQHLLMRYYVSGCVGAHEEKIMPIELQVKQEDTFLLYQTRETQKYGQEAKSIPIQFIKEVQLIYQ
ncbi:hypothetical protein [Vibrio algivorus]|uniref:WYL domain-containing protein n=1 Tax=Vibrio algivorus TaxID=1667024 RepID=A0A557NTI2_9VIBR|nr:hypothetical protein [Vibrio algivorus]TVO31738.1 hypothetical protein FOF44_17755 [Vibrio algivorus]